MSIHALSATHIDSADFAPCADTVIAGCIAAVLSVAGVGVWQVALTYIGG